MSNTVIKVENISKFYQLGLINHGTLAKDLQGWWAKIRGKEDPNSRISLLSSAKNNSDNDFIYALKGVSFDVKQGEVLGIIGANGAGKSTLLKILSRVTSPTSGCIKIKGRIGSLLEVGTGFHPELTGRENIYLNGAILGMRKHEIDRKLDEIIDFSGVEKFIDTPVKRYSSGMYVRLAFAVAAHLDPEILVVDEVLAVGDADFQKKCLGKMDDVSKKEGRTVLFVSHNMAAVKQLCKSGIVLDNGMISYTGPCTDAIDFYLNKINNISDVPIDRRTDRSGSGIYHVKSFSVCGQNESIVIPDNKQLQIQIGFSVKQKIMYPRLIVSINTPTTSVIYLDSKTVAKYPTSFEKDCSLDISLSESFSLKPGRYSINVACYSCDQMTDYVPHIVNFEIVGGSFFETGVTPVGDSCCMIKQIWNFIN